MSAENSSNLLTLPKELQEMIIHHLPYLDRRSLASTCHGLRHLMPGEVQLRLRRTVRVRAGEPFQMALAIPSRASNAYSRGIFDVVLTLTHRGDGGQAARDVEIRLERGGEVVESETTRYMRPNPYRVRMCVHVKHFDFILEQARLILS